MTDSTRDDAPQAAAETPAEESVAEPAAEAKPDEGAKPDMDEMKRKFREALDAKRESHSEGTATGGRDAGRVHGTRGPAAGRRSFRRKSG